MKRKVLVCGASGFLGYNIFKTLSRRSDLSVYGTLLTNKYGRIDANSMSRMFRVDLTHEKEVRDVTRNFDVIIQMAACSTGSRDVVERPYIQVTPNVVINSWIFQAAYDNKVEQVIFPSCTVMYPSHDRPATEVNAELSPKGAYFGAARMKLFSEGMCQFFAELPKSQTMFTAIRHSNMYGPYDRFDPERSHVFGATIRKVLESKDSKVVVWGKGQEIRDFLYVDDFVRFIETVMDRQNYKFDVFNLGSGQPVTIAELVNRVVEISGRELEIVYDPQGPTIGTKISIDISKACNKFNWKPEIPLSEGIARTIDWYRNYHGGV